MARVFLIFVACFAVAPHISEACDTTKYTEQATECTKKVSGCAQDAAGDACKAAKCSIDSLDCVNKASSDAGCCDEMKAAFDASKKAWDDSLKSDAAKTMYKDCDSLEWSGSCGGGADGASAVQVSAMGLIAAMTAFGLSTM